jgi:hypothetical protein
MKRVILALAVLVAALGASMAARAACVTAGDYNRATTSFASGANTITISAEQFGGALTGSGTLCDDTTATTTGAYGSTTIKVNGVTVCSRPDVRLSADPFGFGSGAHGTGGSCGADVSWAEIGSVPSPDTATASGVAEDGTLYTGISRSTGVSGTYWLGGNAPVTLPGGSTGTATRGHYVRAS